MENLLEFKIEIVIATLSLALLAILVLIIILLKKLSELRKPAEDQTALSLLQGQIGELRNELARLESANQQRANERMLSFSDRVDSKLTQTLEGMNRQLGQVSQQLDTRLGEGAKLTQQAAQHTHERLAEAAKAIEGVTGQLASLGEANRHIFNMANNLQELQDILRAPKLRGVLGETFLADMLAQVLPPEHFHLQHAFNSRESVDAVIVFEQGLLPVDAKFPLENFQRMLKAPDEEQDKLRKQFLRDVKKQIDSIAKKYILPDEGTLDFAFMYIPAENVYYETILSSATGEQSLATYAAGKRVIPVSPNSFYAYLQLVMMGIRGLAIQNNAQTILTTLGQLHTDFEHIMDDYRKLGTHLKNAQNSYDGGSKRLEKLGRTLEAQKTLDEPDRG